MALNPVQVRVLGALIEKEIATPEGYPLSLNSLVAACNQRSSRDPVMELAEDEVRQALNTLDDMALTSTARDSRVAKYEHRVRTVWNLRRDETALLCLLFLRGPQTPGELRSRSDRLYSFDELEAVQSTLERMASRTLDDVGTGPLVVVMSKQPGSREARWAHLLGGPVTAESMPIKHGTSGEPGGSDGAGQRSMALRMSELEVEVAALRAAIAAMEARLNSTDRSTTMGEDASEQEAPK